MATVQLLLDDDLVALLNQSNQPVQQTVRELIVLELYRRGTISSGRAGEWLNMPRRQFIEYASSLGIPYYDMTDDEWQDERMRSDSV